MGNVNMQHPEQQQQYGICPIALQQQAWTERKFFKEVGE